MPRAIPSVLLCLGLGLAAGPAHSDPGLQLIRSVQIGLAQAGIRADVSAFDSKTLAALHLVLTSGDDLIIRRDELRAIIAKAMRQE